MFQENSIETCILSRVKQITSPGWIHETSARTWCTGKTQGEQVEREVGGGIGMGNTCKPMAVSFQCMTKFTTNEKKNIFHNTHTTSLMFRTHWPSLCFSNTGCPFIPYSLNHALPFQISAQSLFPWGNVPGSCGHSTFPKQRLSLHDIYQLVFAIFFAIF